MVKTVAHVAAVQELSEEANLMSSVYNPPPSTVAKAGYRMYSDAMRTNPTRDRVHHFDEGVGQQAMDGPKRVGCEERAEILISKVNQLVLTSGGPKV